MLSSLQDQADGKGTIAGSSLEDFLSIAGYEKSSGGSEMSGTLLVTYADNAIDKTWNELKAAVDAGVIPVMIMLYNDGEGDDYSILCTLSTIRDCEENYEVNFVYYGIDGNKGNYLFFSETTDGVLEIVD